MGCQVQHQHTTSSSDGIVKLSCRWQSGPMTSQPLSYRGYRFPPAIISHAVWLYYHFGLSIRDPVVRGTPVRVPSR